MANGASRIFNVIKDTNNTDNSSQLVSLTVKTLSPLTFMLGDKLVITEEFYKVPLNFNVSNVSVGDKFDALVLNNNQLYYILPDVMIDYLLDTKVDKVEGKELSTNDFTDNYKNAVDSNTSARHTHSNKTILDDISSTDISNWNGKAETSDIPTNNNQLTNGAGYQTANDVTTAIDNNQFYYYGTSDTASNTQIKAVTCNGFTLKTGAIINVKFTYSNNLMTIQLNVNSTGDKTITAKNDIQFSWQAGDVIQFIYDGTNWNIVSATSIELNDSYSNSTVNGYTSSYINDLQPITLFTDANGETGPITLNDSASNYTYIEILYIGQNGEPYSTGKLSTSNLSRIHLNGLFITVSGKLNVWSGRIAISGTSLTWNSNRSIVDDVFIDPGNHIAIYKILGYK